MNILVTGGTGELGRAFIRSAGRAGHDIRISSRRPAPPDSTFEWVQADLGIGTGLEDAVAGVDVVVHTASDPRKSATVDVEGTRRLAEAAARAGVRHFVFVSIVGIDRIPFRYYRHKLAAERAIREGGVPHSILRASQFHYFVDLLLRQAARIPSVLGIPGGFRVQSIATAEVADELCRIVGEDPSGMLPELYGPEPMTLRAAAKAWLDVRGMRRPVVSVPLPGSVARAFRAGHNTDPSRPGGRQTWRSWLEERYAR